MLVKLELLPVTNYLPDVDAIKRNHVKVFIGVSEYGLKRKAWYAQVARILAEKLDCELVTFPGHHGSFLDMPNEFSARLTRPTTYSGGLVAPRWPRRRWRAQPPEREGLTRPTSGRISAFTRSGHGSQPAGGRNVM